MKKALTNSLIYSILAGALYFILLVAPQELAFYGGLLFFMLHLLGVLLIKPFYRHAVGEPS